MALTDKALTDEEWEQLHEESRQTRKVASGVIEVQAIKDAQKPALLEVERARAAFLELKPVAQDLVAKMEKERPFRSTNLALNRNLEEHFLKELKTLITYGENNMDEVHRFVNTLNAKIIRDIPGSVAASVEKQLSNCRNTVDGLRDTIAGCERALRDYMSTSRRGIGEPSWEAKRGESPAPNGDHYTGKVLTNVPGNERGID